MCWWRRPTAVAPDRYRVMVRSTRPLRVFLSHTSELASFPDDGSFVRAAEEAVTRAGHAVTEMAYFTSRDQKSADYCERKVRQADVYVGLLGFRYGSPVRGRPEVSSSELEYETAGAARCTRLVFLIDESTQGPREFFVDREHGERQEEFRRRVQKDGVVATVRTPEELTTLVLQALTELPLPD